MPLPVIILPGYFAPASEYYALAQQLQAEGVTATIVPLTTWDWVPTLGGRSIQPILEKIDQTVQAVRARTDQSPVNLVGHSAGGWIARIYLGAVSYDVHGMQPDKTYAWKAHEWVDRLITLGTPHRSQERWTRKNLDFVNQTYPDAYHSDVRYICIAGKSVYGQKGWGQATWSRWLAYSSYELTCGEGSTWGDGITPIAAAHLQGAENITLENVRHAPKSPDRWYGSPEVLSAWIDYLR
jgi:triacylglycerol esterase/lipase EstA (alpha/beta hydrolase family)